ncbi:MAG TPA: YggS family pyridoxal phosphate-dependent enzyme, partial [Candidatus Sabulitectum sp.]|nr:YggS family pyridoxal phosphate-dependent enzyme [Candidatus Sabulitectum sp.]
NHNLAHVREEIEKACLRSGRNAGEVEIMAVTKTHPAEYVEAAISCGVKHIGENRVSEGGRKVSAVGRDRAIFHLIGVIHRSEVRQAVRDFHCIDAVDRLRILEEIVRREASPRILLEVNTSGEKAKKGFPPDGTLLENAMGFALENGLSVEGLLTVVPWEQAKQV